MKKKIKTLTAVLLCAALCLSAFAFFPACTTADDDTPDYADLVVHSNGGTVVTVGNEVFFVNGVPDYTDADGNTNITGNVVKGALYKTTVTSYRDTVANTEASLDEEDADPEDIADGLTDVMDFADFTKYDYKEMGYYTIGSETEPGRVLDENGNYVQNYIPTNGGRSEYRIDTESVIAKKIGTSGYAEGGFWIFDGIVYFATPDTDRDSEGNVQYDRAEFYSYDLTTGSMTLIRTATQVSNSVPYAFYKRGSHVYLVTFETYYANADDETNNILTGFLLSTEITDGRPGDTTVIAEDVDSVYFPRVETYDPASNPASSLEHYVYFTTTNDSESDTSVLAMIRPDGVLPATEEGEEDGTGYKIITTSTVGDITIEGTTSDYLYYRNPLVGGTTALECTNLEYQLLEYDPEAKVFAMEHKTIVADVSAYTSFLPVEQDKSDEGTENVLPCVMAVASDGIYRVVPGVPNTKVFNGTSTILGYNDGRIYFTYTISSEDEEEEDTTTEDTEEDTSTDVNMLVSCSAFEPYGNQTASPLDASLPSSTFDIDFFDISYATNFAGNKNYTATESYVFYFSDYSSYETSYGLINKVSGVYDMAGAGSIRLGTVADFDRPTIMCYDEECLNWLHDHSTWDDLTPDEEEGENGYTQV